jgi:NADH dehydrogenase (ubiquinone) 1 alpha subcomplex subunit 9
MCAMLQRSAASSTLLNLRGVLAGAAANSSSSSSSSRQYATDLQTDVAHIGTSLTNVGMRAGPGGRSSVSGITATIFGATGFLGRYFAAALAKRGSQVVCPYRCDDLDIQHLRVMGDLGQVVTLPDFSARDDTFIRKAVAQSNVVINLIGEERETPRFGFEEVHVDIAQRIAQAAADSGVCERLIHVSCLGASPDSASRRLQTKAAGEEAVRQAFPSATILKPSVLVGTEDRMFNSFARLAMNLPYLPLTGRDAQVQPVYVRDVTEALEAILKDKGTIGKTYALAGPRTYTRQELVQLVYNTVREKNTSFYYPDTLALLAAKPREFLMRRGIAIPTHTMFTEDYIREAAEDNILQTSTADGTFADLGISPQRIDVGLPIEHVRHYRVGGYDVGTTSGTEASPTGAAASQATLN